MAEQHTHGAIVIGDGPIGRTAALALAPLVGRIAMIERVPPEVPAAAAAPASVGRPLDTRTAALFPSSVRLLQRLDVWEACAADAAPLAAIRLIDDTGGLLAAPDVVFAAAEIGLEHFGYNLPNASLQAALRSRMALSPAIERYTTSADVRLNSEPAGARASWSAPGSSASNLATAPLLVGADGRTSPVREAAGIVAETWSYPQVAIATAFDHGRPHDNVSTEFHRRSGPLTVVPMPGNSASLVWVETPAEAERLLALDDDRFRRALEARLGGLLGAITAIGPRRGFPLAGLRALRMSARRSVLVGEAAHVFPPIGAQGLNLGLRDVAALYDCAAAAGAEGLGELPMLEAYHRARDLDVRSRTFAVDALNRSLLTSLIPGQLLRGLGLTLASSIAPLRRAMMRQGLSDLVAEPSLMRAG